MFHRRCLLQFVLLGIFLESSVYLWTKSIHYNRIQMPTEESNNTDFLSDDNESTIEPFAELKLDETNVIQDINMFQVYDWWDLWNGDQQCNRHQVHLLKPGTQPQPGAFVSFPGSGNTWLRSLLMGVTGVYVTSSYIGENRHFHNSTFEVPPDCGCSLLQKTHDFSLDGNLPKYTKEKLNQLLNQFNGKGILIIRDPFKAIQSYRNFQFGGMKGTAPARAFKGAKWDSFMSRAVASWETLAKVWIRGLKQGGVVYYELLRKDTKFELKRMMKLIGFKYDKDRLDCVLRHAQDNPMKRKSRSKLTNPYTASQRLLIHKAIENVQQVLKERGLDPLPVEYYDLFDITPEYGLD